MNNLLIYFWLYHPYLTNKNIKGIAIPKRYLYHSVSPDTLKKSLPTSDRDCVEYILYHPYIAGFSLVSDVFLIQLGYICSRYQKDYLTICLLLDNPVLCPIYLILYKDQQFKNYIVKYSRQLIMKEMNKLISSL